jgi:hypothetical protein
MKVLLRNLVGILFLVSLFSGCSCNGGIENSGSATGGAGGGTQVISEQNRAGVTGVTGITSLLYTVGLFGNLNDIARGDTPSGLVIKGQQSSASEVVQSSKNYGFNASLTAFLVACSNDGGTADTEFVDPVTHLPVSLIQEQCGTEVGTGNPLYRISTPPGGVVITKTYNHCHFEDCGALINFESGSDTAAIGGSVVIMDACLEQDNLTYIFPEGSSYDTSTEEACSGVHVQILNADGTVQMIDGQPNEGEMGYQWTFSGAGQFSGQICIDNGTSDQTPVVFADNQSFTEYLDSIPCLILLDSNKQTNFGVCYSTNSAPITSCNAIKDGTTCNSSYEQVCDGNGQNCVFHNCFAYSGTDYCFRVDDLVCIQEPEANHDGVCVGPAPGVNCSDLTTAETCNVNHDTDNHNCFYDPNDKKCNSLEILHLSCTP